LNPEGRHPALQAMHKIIMAAPTNRAVPHLGCACQRQQADNYESITMSDVSEYLFTQEVKE